MTKQPTFHPDCPDNNDAARAKRVAHEEIRKLESKIEVWRLVLRALDADAEIAGENDAGKE